MERIAYVEGMEGKADHPQFVVPLHWDPQSRRYQGTFALPKSGRWYFTLGTVIPDALSATMEADSDYVGLTQTLDLPEAAWSPLEIVSQPVWPDLIIGLAVSVLVWLRSLLQRSKANRQG
jgi:hypothetical protein